MNFELLAHVTALMSEVAHTTDSRRIAQIAHQLRYQITHNVPLTIRTGVRPIADVFGDSI